VSLTGCRFSHKQKQNKQLPDPEKRSDVTSKQISEQLLFKFPELDVKSIPHSAANRRRAGSLQLIAASKRKWANPM
jgi:hypothetical protein